MGNLRIPNMRITSEHVLGMLQFMDRRAPEKSTSVPVPGAKPLRFPKDFPGARPTLARDVALLDAHGSDADVIIELDALYEDSRTAMIASAQGMDEAECGLDDLVDLPSLPKVVVTQPTPETVEIAVEPTEPTLKTGTIAPKVAPRSFLPAKSPAAAAKPEFPSIASQARLFKSLPLAGGPPSERASYPLRADPVAQRAERLTRAIGWLKKHHRVLVTVVDRDAQIRQYLVTGKRFRMLADDVIDHAKSLGMDIDG